MQKDMEDLVHLKLPHLFWILNLLDYKPQAKNTAEGADVFPSLPSCQQQESDLEASLDHCATQPFPYPLGSRVFLQPRPVQKLAAALSPDSLTGTAGLQRPVGLFIPVLSTRVEDETLP